MSKAARPRPHVCSKGALCLATLTPMGGSSDKHGYMALLILAKWEYTHFICLLWYYVSVISPATSVPCSLACVSLDLFCLMPTAVKCPDLQPPVNGFFSDRLPPPSMTFRFNTLVSFRCQRGFSLVGSAARRCHANGSWSGIQPTCRGIWETKMHNWTYYYYY